MAERAQALQQWWRDPPPSFVRRTGRKVPEVTALFWIVKLLTTAMGEASSDWAVHTINPVIAVAVAGLVFAGAMAWQLRVPRYIPWVYWSAVAMVAVFGTMVADVIHIALGVPYVVSTIGFGILLVVVFRTWYRTEGTLSIHSIDSPRRELFYWSTVLTTFALGTALGDMTAHTLGLGFFTSGVAFAAVIVIPVLAHRFAGLDEVAAFWGAYIVTRPLGASFADWAGVPRALGGLDLGRGRVTAVLSLLIVALVAYLSATWEERRVPTM
jgi:uncharacterized membrane-anchored protein